MPIGRSAKKSLRKSIRRRAANLTFRKTVKKTIKEFLANPAEAGLKKVNSILDKAVKKNIYHKNKVARLKSKYAKKVKKGKVVAAPKKKTKRTVKEKMVK
jgi:small subunit ribosomal protein S20